MFTKGPGTYKIPGFRDIPQVFNVSLLKDVEWENLRTIQRSRGVGEPPLFMGSSVFFAIRDALKAARREWGIKEGGVWGAEAEGKANTAGSEPDVVEDKKEVSDKVFTLWSPATVERIRTSVGDPISERVRVVPRDGEKSFFVTI
jgi:xanthine dehydrogenase/oxidase